MKKPDRARMNRLTKKRGRKVVQRKAKMAEREIYNAKGEAKLLYAQIRETKYVGRLKKLVKRVLHLGSTTLRGHSILVTK